MSRVAIETAIGQGTAGRIREAGEGRHILSGLAVAQTFDILHLKRFSRQIHEGVAEHKGFMRQFESRDLLDQMQNGSFVLSVQQKDGDPRLLAAAQVFPVKGSDVEKELGTVLRVDNGPNSKGQSEAVVREAAWLGINMENSHGVVALVAIENRIAQNFFGETLGAVPIGEQPSDYVKTPEGLAVPMTIFDVRDIAQR